MLQQLVLSEESYVRQHFEESPWHEELERDRRFCHAFFFVGYSLRDHHISALLLQNPTSRDKTYFVNGTTADTVFANRTAKYGSILRLSAERFTALCHQLPAPRRGTNPNSLKAFRHLDPFKDKKTLLPPTPIEILNLVTYGTFNSHRFLSSSGKKHYIAPRQDTIDDAVKKLQRAPSLLVHSLLGNGKSIFLYSLAYKLAEIGYTCFYSRDASAFVRQDLDLLKAFGPVALFFDSHNSAIDLMDQLRDLPSTTRFVIAVRSSVLDLRRHVFAQKLPAPIENVSVNRVDKEDKAILLEILDRSGVRVSNIEQVIRQGRDFREIVTTLYDNSAIKEKIRNELAPLLKDRDFNNILIATHLLKINGDEANPAVLRGVTGSDPYLVVSKFPTIARDILGLEDDDEVESKSALFSEYMIQNHVATEDMMNCVYLIVSAAVKRKNEPRYQAVLSKLMRYSDLSRALCNDANRSEALAGLFERLAKNVDVNREPLFWLQYAILMRDREELLAAEGFIATAYARAAEKPGFQTYQIDTYALQLLMLIEARDASHSTVPRLGQILERMERVQHMIEDENHVLHAVRAVSGIETFVVRCASALSTTERLTLDVRLRHVVDKLRPLAKIT